MKRLLMIGAAALAFAGGASAAEMPKDLQGDWCVVVPGKFMYSQEPEACPPAGEPDMTMTVDARGFSAFEDLCYLRKVTLIDVYPWGRKPYKNTGQVYKNPWGQAYEMTFRCLGMDAPATIVKQRWDIEKGVLTVTLPRRK
jgi:hypothetical protein